MTQQYSVMIFRKMCEVLRQSVSKASNILGEKLGIGIIVSPRVKAVKP